MEFDDPREMEAFHGHSHRKLTRVNHEKKTVVREFNLDPLGESYVTLKKLYQREVEICLMLRGHAHPRFVEMIDFEEIDGLRAVIRLKYVGPMSLSEVIFNARYTYTVSTVLLYSEQIFDGLCFLHSNGYVHRDIKPSKHVTSLLSFNEMLSIMVDADGNLKIGDLETAKLHNPYKSNSHSFATYGYRPPESIYSLENLNPTFPPSGDVYSAGVVTWEMIMRRRCFPNIEEEIHLHIQRFIPPLTCHWEFAEFVRECTMITPEARPEAKDVLLRIRKLRESKRFDQHPIMPQLCKNQKLMLLPAGLGLEHLIKNEEEEEDLSIDALPEIEDLHDDTPAEKTTTSTPPLKRASKVLSKNEEPDAKRSPTFDDAFLNPRLKGII